MSTTNTNTTITETITVSRNGDTIRVVRENGSTRVWVNDRELAPESPEGLEAIAYVDRVAKDARDRARMNPTPGHGIADRIRDRLRSRFGGLF